MKIAVLGAAGQLGRDLCPRLLGEVIPLTRAEIDLSRRDTIRPALTALRPDVVVNCAAYNLVDRAESEPEAVFAVNTLAVREIALACRDLSALLVHFSTDYVFGLDAARRTPWQEEDVPGPVSVYGLSKLAGEQAVRANCPEHLILRTCGLYGVHGTGGKGGNFVETMLRLARENKPLRVVADQICTPSYTVDVAKATVRLLEKRIYGTYHVTNAGGCSWHQFASAVFELSGMDVRPAAITSAEYGAPARRPAYSILDGAGLRRLGLPALRPWRDALAAYLEERRRLRSV